MIDRAAVESFLEGRRIAVVGASDDEKSFGNTVYRAFRDHGYETVAVHPTATTVAGDACYARLGDVPGAVDGAVVMVKADRAADVVDECVRCGIDRVWLFKGLGGPGALSDDAVRTCREHGITVVEGACPFMFLEPVGWFHRVHRVARHLNGSLARAS